MITSLDLDEEIVKKIDACVQVGKQEVAALFGVPEDYLSAKGRHALEQLKKETAFVGSSRSSVIVSILRHYFAGESAELFKKELEPKAKLDTEGKPLTYSERQHAIRRPALPSSNAQ